MFYLHLTVLFVIVFNPCRPCFVILSYHDFVCTNVDVINFYLGKVAKDCDFNPNSFCARYEKLKEGADLPPPAHIVKKIFSNLVAYVSWCIYYIS